MEPLGEILFLPKLNFNGQFLLKALKTKNIIILHWCEKGGKYDQNMVIKDGK